MVLSSCHAFTASCRVASFSAAKKSLMKLMYLPCGIRAKAPSV